MVQIPVVPNYKLLHSGSIFARLRASFMKPFICMHDGCSMLHISVPA